MRQTIRDQLTLAPPLRAQHFPKAQEYEEISRILDECPGMGELVLADLLAGGVDPNVGRDGMSGDQVIRAKIVKQREGLSYRDLAFEIAANEVFRSFCRLPIWKTWSKSTLHRNLSCVGAATLEQANQLVLKVAERDGFEDGNRIATDGTALETNVHPPSDSALLMDVVRVSTRLQILAAEHFVDVYFEDPSSDAARLHWRISNARRRVQRLPYYKDLLVIADQVLHRSLQIATELDRIVVLELQAAAAALAQELRRIHELGVRVVAQTRSRVIDGKPVKAQDKVLSLFEEHTDLIVQGNSMTFGHKITLTTGRSRLILDVVVERGNPADCTLTLRMLERQVALYGRPPTQAAFDGGYSSLANLSSAKRIGVKDVVFSKHPGIAISDMTGDAKTFEELRCFRTSVERVISIQKRCYGLRRCDWVGLAGFEAYVWTSAFAGNLVTLARLRLARKRRPE